MPAYTRASMTSLSICAEERLDAPRAQEVLTSDARVYRHSFRTADTQEPCLGEKVAHYLKKALVPAVP